MDPFLQAETCRQTIWLDKSRGVSADGRATPQFDPSAGPYAARVEREVVVVMMQDGTRANTSHRIITPAQAADVDRLYLADPLSGAKSRRILRIRELADEYGAFDHCEIWV